MQAVNGEKLAVAIRQVSTLCFGTWLVFTFGYWQLGAIMVAATPVMAGAMAILMNVVFGIKNPRPTGEGPKALKSVGSLVGEVVRDRNRSPLSRNNQPSPQTSSFGPRHQPTLPPTSSFGPISPRQPTPTTTLLLRSSGSEPSPPTARRSDSSKTVWRAPTRACARRCRPPS